MIVGKDQKLLEFFRIGYRFIIPAYQRNYDWKTQDCERLYDDLIKLSKSKRDGHFFGSVVTVESPTGYSEERLVIDGQQRLTTVTLLLLAIYKLLKAGAISANDQFLADIIYKGFLVDDTRGGEGRLKLKPIKSDNEAIEKLFKSNEEAIPTSNLTINYNYFLARIQKSEISVDELYKAICRLVIIKVELKQEDDPQLVFESLNSTGVALTEGDKIRNFILMGLDFIQQDDFYERYWNKIEIAVGYDVSPFIRDYLTIKTPSIPSQNKVYQAFKDYRTSNPVSAEELLKDLYEYATYYKTLLTGNTGQKSIDECIFRLNHLETSVTRPFLLEVLKHHAHGVISSDDLAEIFLTVESYLFRRAICEIPTNALNKIFQTLNRDIIRLDGTEDSYAAKFKYVLRTKKDRAVFPEDADFEMKFRTRDIYKMNAKNRVYILERLNNYGSRETYPIYEQMAKGSGEGLTVEHIMPQILTPWWVAHLGEDYDNIHKTWLHRIANLTLTAYNSSFSNKSFDDKLNDKNGFKHSRIWLNRWISEQTAWHVEELTAREDALWELAREIWPLPETSFILQEKQNDEVSLDDDVNLRGRSISAFSFKGQLQPVTNWIEMFNKVVMQLHSLDKSIVTRLANSDDPSIRMSQYFSTNPDKLREATEIDTGLYVERNSNTDIKVVILRELFDLFKEDPEDLVFVLRDETASKSTEQEALRHDIRRRYWALALPKMREANSDNGMFSGWTQTKQNWCSGFFGVAGCHIDCIANFNCARVDFYMTGNSRFTAKELFKFLFSKKAMIEGALAIPIKWEKGETTKYSRISFTMEDVSIANESDWQKMADFHASWSKKFHEVLVPIVQNFVTSRN